MKNNIYIYVIIIYIKHIKVYRFILNMSDAIKTYLETNPIDWSKWNKFKDEFLFSNPIMDISSCLLTFPDVAPIKENECLNCAFEQTKLIKYNPPKSEEEIEQYRKEVFSTCDYYMQDMCSGFEYIADMLREGGPPRMLGRIHTVTCPLCENENEVCPDDREY